MAGNRLTSKDREEIKAEVMATVKDTLARQPKKSESDAAAWMQDQLQVRREYEADLQRRLSTKDGQKDFRAAAPNLKIMTKKG